jgi:hypothetical protein
VDRRREPRVECRETVRIEVLGDRPRVLSGTLCNISGRGARIESPESLPVNAMLRIDSSSAIFLGDVCYCFPQSGSWQVGVKLAHAFRSDPGLKNLAQRLNEESANSSLLAPNPTAPTP